MTNTRDVLAYATEVAYVRFRVPDLAVQREFLGDFGLTVLGDAGAASNTLYARGEGGRAFLYQAEAGPAKFIGLGFQMSSRADLDALAMLEEATEVRPIEGPGGGE